MSTPKLSKVFGLSEAVTLHVEDEMEDEVIGDLLYHNLDDADRAAISPKFNGKKVPYTVQLDDAQAELLAQELYQWSGYNSYGSSKDQEAAQTAAEVLAAKLEEG